MRSLYELTSDYLALLDLMDAEEIDEDAIRDTLEGLTGVLEDKVDGLCGVIKQLDAEASAIGAEKKRLDERLKRKKAEAERAKKYLSDMLRRVGMTKFENPRHKVRFNKGEKLVYTDELAVLDYLKEHYPDMVTTEVVESVSKNDVKKAIKDGVEIPFTVIECSMSISVK